MKEDQKFHWLAIAFLTLFATGLYLNSLNNTFHFDDIQNIVGNPYIRNLKDVSFFLSGFKAGQLNRFRTLPILSFAVNYHFHKVNVLGYHLVNLGLHILSGILVYFISRKLFILGFKIFQKANPSGPRPKGRGPLSPSVSPKAEPHLVTLPSKTGLGTVEWVNLLAVFTSAIFISHPIQVNTVTYIVERNEGLACLFYLLGFFLFMKMSFSKGWLKGIYFLGTGIAFLSAVLSKETGFTLPIVLILFDLMFVCKNREMIKKRVIIYFGVGCLLSLYLLFFLREGIFTILFRQTHLWTPWENLLTQLNVIIQYFKLIILPLPQWLNVDHDFQLSKSFFEYPTFLSASVILLLLFSAAMLVKKNRFVSFCIFFFFIFLIPSSSLIPIWDLMVEYRLYLPLFSYALLLSLGLYFLNQWLTRRFSKKMGQWLIGGFCIFLLSFYSLTTIERNKIFKNELSLWTDASQKSPDKIRPKHNLITAYNNQGLYDQAIATSLEVLKKEPKNDEIYLKMGVAYLMMGEKDKAIENLNTSIQIKNINPMAYNNLGILYIKKGDFDQAMAAFKQAIFYQPKYAEAYNNLAKAFAMKGLLDEAIKEETTAIRIDPAMAEYHFNLAKLYENKGLTKEGIREYKEALRVDPYFFEAHLHLGILYSHLGSHREAIAAFEHALKINPDSGKSYFMLGVNLIRVGEKEKATRNLEKALQYATHENDKKAIESVLSRLRSVP